MTKEEEKDKLNDDNSANTDTQKNNISFFNRLKQQVKTLNFKNEKQEIADENITQVDNEIVLEEELKRKEKEIERSIADNDKKSETSCRFIALYNMISYGVTGFYPALENNKEQLKQEIEEYMDCLRGLHKK